MLLPQLEDGVFFARPLILSMPMTRPPLLVRDIGSCGRGTAIRQENSVGRHMASTVI